MRCKLCKALTGDLVDMELSGAPGLWFCPTDGCPCSVLLVDVGLMLAPPGLPPQPSPFREPEPEIGRSAYVKTCANCLEEFTSQQATTTGCSEACKRQLRRDVAKAREAAKRAALLTEPPTVRCCAWEGCAVEFLPVFDGQIFHTSTCRALKIGADRRRVVFPLGAPETVGAP